MNLYDESQQRINDQNREAKTGRRHHAAKDFVSAVFLQGSIQKQRPCNDKADEWNGDEQDPKDKEDDHSDISIQQSRC